MKSILNQLILPLVCILSYLMISLDGCDKEEPKPHIPESTYEAFIMETTDGGQTWGPQTRIANLKTVNSGTLMDSDQYYIFVAGLNYNSEASIMRGISKNDFVEVFTREDRYFNSICASKELANVVGVGNNGMIYCSNNYGNIWSYKTGDIFEIMYGVDLYTMNDPLYGQIDFGCAVGKQGTIFVSNDNGYTWTNVNTSSGYDIWDIEILGGEDKDQLRIFACANNSSFDGEIFYSENSGSTWERKIISQDRVNAIDSGTDLEKGKYLIAVGDLGKIFKSQHPFTEWDEKETDTEGTLTDVFISDFGVCLALGNSFVLCSENNGESWFTVFTDSNVELKSIVMLKESIHGYIVGHKDTSQ